MQSAKTSSLKALRESVLIAIGVTSLSGCWSSEPSDCSSSSKAGGESSGYQVCESNIFKKTGPTRCEGDLSDLDAYGRPVDACMSDDDCPANQLCWCDGNYGGQCRPSNCRSGNQCGSNFCMIYEDFGSGGCDLGGDYSAGCFSTESDCLIDDDCGEGMNCVLSSLPSGDLLGSCDIKRESIAFGACGRPVYVEEGPLEAPLERGGEGWLSPHHAGSTPVGSILDTLAVFSPAERETLLERWSMIARLEHSSVASFSRVTLELMALGAPAELLAETQSAAQDELRHAQQAVDVVSALREEEVSFGAFPSSSMTLRGDRDAVLCTLIEEACVGECFGVAEAEGERAAMMQAGGPPPLLERVERIIADELRHAALAWRTLAWLLEGDQPNEAERARRAELALTTLIDATRKTLTPPRERGPFTPALGLLSPSERGALRRRALAEVLLPASTALFGDRARALLCSL